MTIVTPQASAKPAGEGEDVEAAVTADTTSTSSSLSNGNGSTAKLLPPVKPAKRKSSSVLSTPRRRRFLDRLKSVIWFLLFGTALLVVMAIVATLVENFSMAMMSGGSCSSDSQSFSFPATPHRWDYDDIEEVGKNLNMVEVSPAELKDCVYRRNVWVNGACRVQIVHDFSVKWSAIVNNESNRCMLFNMQKAYPPGCPQKYPWELDEKMGVAVCKGPLARVAPLRRVMHHIIGLSLTNITFTGPVISNLCSGHSLYIVDRVVIQYYDDNFSGRPRRSAPAEEGKTGALTEAGGRVKREISNNNAEGSLKVLKSDGLSVPKRLPKDSHANNIDRGFFKLVSVFDKMDEAQMVEHAADLEEHFGLKDNDSLKAAEGKPPNESLKSRLLKHLIVGWLKKEAPKQEKPLENHDSDEAKVSAKSKEGKDEAPISVSWQTSYTLVKPSGHVITSEKLESVYD